MPRSFLIKPRKHRLLKEERTQDVIPEVYFTPSCHQSPGRISEDSGIEDSDPLMSPRSTDECVRINSPGTPEAPKQASLSRSLEVNSGYHDNLQTLQLVPGRADADSKTMRLSSPPSPTTQLQTMGQTASENSSPPAPGTRQVGCIRDSRSFKHLPLIKRPFFQEMTSQEERGSQERGAEEGVSQERGTSSNVTHARVHESPMNTVQHVHQDNFFHPTLTSPEISPLNLSTSEHDSPSYKVQHKQLGPVSGGPPRIPLSPVQEASSPQIIDPRFTSQWTEKNLTAAVDILRSVTSSTPRAHHHGNLENRRPKSPRMSPYNVPSKHYFTNITRIASERSHNYVSIIKGQEVKSSAERSLSAFNEINCEAKRSTVLQPLNVSTNHIASPPQSHKRPEVHVTSQHYTVLTPSRPSVNHLQELQQLKEMKPVQRSLQMQHSPQWDAENRPAAIFQDGYQDGFQDGRHENVRRDISRFKCEDCSKSYATFSGLTKHKQFHCSALFKKEFSCKYCSKTYVSLGALKMHVRTHTLPCKCPLCGKAFSRPWLLQGHIRTHTGEKPFNCNHCSRAFADRSNLRAHLQTHTDIKKYNCKKCPKTFSRMSLLLKHEDGGCINNI